MEWRAWMVAALLLCGSLTPARAFSLGKRAQTQDEPTNRRLHKRSYRTEDEIAANRLADALELIQKERLRFQDDSLSPFKEAPIQNAFYDDGGYEEEEEPNEPTAADVQEFLAGLFGDRSGYASPDMEELLAEEEPAPLRIANGDSELEDIFANDEEEQEAEKKDLPVPLEPKRMYDPSEEKKADDSLAKLSDEEVQQMLDDIEQTEIAELQRQEQEEEDDSLGTTQPASQEEIEDMLKDDEDNLEAEEAEEEEEEDGEDWRNMGPSEEVDLTRQDDWPNLYPANEVGINKEWLIGQYLNAADEASPSIKRKRSGPVYDDLDAGGFDEDDEEEEDVLGEELIAKFLAYEDDQNDNLVKALDLATRAQIEQTDKYIPQEVEYIRSAISDEQLIQAIKNLVNPDGEEEEEEEAAEEEEELEEEERQLQYLPPMPLEAKRASPINADLDDVPMDEDTQALIAQAMAKALRRYFYQHPEAAEEVDETEDNEVLSDLPELVGKWEDAPIDDLDEGTPSQSELELNPFYRKLMEQYSSDLRKRNDPQLEEDFRPEEEDESLFLVDDNLPITEADICPAVGLTDGCAFAEQQGLVMDAEARDLCNRHQLCYTCGSVFGMTAEACDQGFIGETDRICEGDVECRMEAVELYIAMSSNHIAVPASFTHHACNNPCSFDYIVGGTADKKR